MQRRLSYLSLKGLTGRLHAVTVQLLIVALVLPTPQAIASGKPQDYSVSYMMGLPGFKGMVLTIAMVNKAMQDAAENPMDEWRRANVRTALAMMPAALAGLAGEFSKRSLGDSNLPKVQAILGGFVDVNAADKYKKFLAKPDKSLIPSVGAGFPKVQPPPVPQKGPALASTGSSKDAAASVGSQLGSVGSTVSSKETVSLGQRMEAKGTASTKSVVFDDNAPKASQSDSGGSAVGSIGKSVDGTPKELSDSNSASALRPPASVSNSTTSANLSNSTGQDNSPRAAIERLPYAGSNTVLEASRELSTIEQRTNAGETRSLTTIRRDGKKSEELNQEEFFGNVGASTKAKNKAKAPQRRPSTKPTSSLGNSHFLRYFAIALDFGMCLAHAEGGDQSQEKESGGQAAAILMAMAAMMAAVVPAIVASIQANADKAIAKTNADAQIKMTQISADTQKEANRIAENVALTQSATAQQVAAMNNAGVSDRLQMQLAELRSARTDARQAEDQRRQLDDQYNQQRLALAEKQSQQNLDLAKETLAAQLSEAGLRQSYSNSTNSSSRLETTSTLGVGSVASTSGNSNGARTGAGMGVGGGTAAQASAGIGALATRTNGPISNSANTGVAMLNTDKSATDSSTSGRVSSLGLTTRGVASENGFTRGFGEDVGLDISEKDKVACKSKKTPEEIKKCFSETAAASKRGFKSNKPQNRLLVGTMASNDNAPRSFARRLSAATGKANMVSGSNADSADALAFAGEKPSALVPKSNSGFGSFLNQTTSDGSFSKFRESAGTPHRELSSTPKVSGGHSANGGRGMLNLINE